MEKIFSNDKIDIYKFNSDGQVVHAEFSKDGSIALRTLSSHIQLNKEHIDFIKTFKKEEL